MNYSSAQINTPDSNTVVSKPSTGGNWDSYKLYDEERKAVRADFEGLNINDTENPEVRKKLSAFSKKIVERVTFVLPSSEIIDMALPRQEVGIGITIEAHELGGAVVHEGVYGGAVRMSKPIQKPYTLTTKLKEVGQELVLANIQSGKYSPSEIGDYVGMLIGASRNRLLFHTLENMSAYAGSGTQVTSGAGLGIPTMIVALKTLTDGADAKVIFGRRNALYELSNNPNFSDQTERDFEERGQIGNFAGVPVVKVNSFTDPIYGFVYPMRNDDLWIFSEQPAGRFGVTSDVVSSSEIIMRRGVMHLYYRWDDGLAIWKTDRIARVSSIT